VAVDDQDRVYVLNRGGHPVIVFDREGTFVGSWGEGLFKNPHGLTWHDGFLYAVDNFLHVVFKCTPEGRVVLTLGTPDAPAPWRSGKPFSMPTKAAVDPRTGDILVADGYKNARVHRYSAAGKWLHSFGEYGSDPGQFNLVHSLAVDAQGRIFIADRENCRVQVFDENGRFLAQWNNLHRPCGLCIKGKRAYIGQLSTSPVNEWSNPNVGACVSVHTLAGKRLDRLGDPVPGIGPGQFTAPHGIAVDSRGDIYVGEVSWAEFGRVQDPPREVRSLTKLALIGSPVAGNPDEDSPGGDEELIRQALEIIRETKRPSTSVLQRRLKIGYTRAARIMDILEERGIVGPVRGTQYREILIDLDSIGEN
jgi:DNA-binding beta-propeller fold protein YncE